VFLRSGMVLRTDDGELGCGLTGVVGRLRTSSLEALSSTFSALTLSTEFLASEGLGHGFTRGGVFQWLLCGDFRFAFVTLLLGQ
jgi:hypothetical protein